MANERWSLKGLYRTRMQNLLKENYGIKLPIEVYQAAKWYDQYFLKNFLFEVDRKLHNDDDLYAEIWEKAKQYFKKYPERGVVTDEDAFAIALLVNNRKQYYDIIHLWTKWFIHHKGTDGMEIFEPRERNMIIEHESQLKTMDTQSMAEFFAWLWD